jgi:hypothetical protein
VYAKLFTSIYQGTLRGNSHGLLVFTNMLAHCDKAGVCDMHPKAIAEEVGLTVEQVRAALDELEAPDFESRSPEDEGRRIKRLDEHRAWGWTVVNYAKYRAIRDEDDRREQNRLSQERWRNKHKPQSATVSQGKPVSAHTEAEADTEASKEKTARKRAAPFAPPADVDPQVWSDWVAHRKAKRAPVSQTVLDGAVSEAQKAGMTLEAFLRVWCTRGSQGMVAAWLKPEERGLQSGSEPAWRTEKRQRTAEFLGLKPATKTAEVFDVAARRLD